MSLVNLGFENMVKPHIQKLPLNEQTSFVARTYRTPHFEVGWHQHIEHELILFTEGSGLGFIGNYVGEFDTGDIYLIGSNLPHTFQKTHPELVTSAIVVQFRADFWGEGFINLPEYKEIHRILTEAAYGMKLGAATKGLVSPLIQELEDARGFKRILLLGQALEMIALGNDLIPTSTQHTRHFNHKDKERIDQVFQFTIDNFKEHITLEQVAGIACMSVPAFCNYFKRSTQKTYVDFLNEVKIGYASTLLLETNKPIKEICYDSGYSTPVNFHKQFVAQKRLTPLQYRKNNQRIFES